MKKIKVCIIGCGSIFNRHLEAIELNSDLYELNSICDINEELSYAISSRLKVNYYTKYTDIKTKDIDLVVIATPNSQHYEQSIYFLKNNCDILVEKPVCFNTKQIDDIKKVSKEYNRNAYCVLQVRLNPTVQIAKKVIEHGLIGKIRGVSLIQRWQRPMEYFTGWRSEPMIGGGTLYECGIHYIDALQYLFGVPDIISSKTYKTKHKHQLIEDTIYSLFDFGDFGGNCEITISAEPQNIETSISILGSNGYLKLGGKALNIIESYNFLSNGSKVLYENIIKEFPYSKTPNSYGSYQGSCPNHPELYKNMATFDIMESRNVIEIIDNIYLKSNIKYY